MPEDFGFQPDPADQFGFQPDKPTETRGILKQYWDKINPVTAAQGIAQAVQHPIDTAKAYAANTAAMGDKAADAFKKGNYGEGVRHALGYFLNGIPGLGSALDEAGDKAQSGDYQGAIADTAALATQLGAPKLASAGAGAAGVATDAVKGAAQSAARSVADISPGTAKVAGGIAGGMAGRMTGIPYGTTAGAAIGYRLGPKLIAKLKAALENPGAENVTALKEALQQEEVPPIPESRQLTTGSIKAGPVPDATSVKITTGEPLTYPGPRQLPPVADSTAAQSAASRQELLDGIAQGTFKAKNFASLGDRWKPTVERLAQQIQNQPAPEPAPQAPAPQPPAAAPQPPAATPQPPAPAPQPPAPPASPAVTTIPFSKPDVPAEVFEQKARGVKAINLAKWLSDAGITSEDAARMTDDHWAMASKGAGVNKPSSMSQQEALFRLRQIEALKQSSPQMVDRLQKTGALPAALELQRLMSPVTPPTLPTQ